MRTWLGTMPWAAAALLVVTAAAHAAPPGIFGFQRRNAVQPRLGIFLAALNPANRAARQAQARGPLASQPASGPRSAEQELSVWQGPALTTHESATSRPLAPPSADAPTPLLPVSELPSPAAEPLAPPPSGLPPENAPAGGGLIIPDIADAFVSDEFLSEGVSPLVPVQPNSGNVR